jgi:hypothetical protein
MGRWGGAMRWSQGRVGMDGWALSERWFLFFFFTCGVFSVGWETGGDDEGRRTMVDD